jgi:osmotically-inducible protein OsmY
MSVRMLGHVLLMGSLAGVVACDREPDNRAEVEMRERSDDAARTADRTGDRIGGAVEDAARATGHAAEAARETADIKAAFAADDLVAAHDIDVDTDAEAKVVTLTGRVDTEAQKERAETIAKRETEGYRIDNRLVVGAS